MADFDIGIASSLTIELAKAIFAYAQAHTIETFDMTYPTNRRGVDDRM